LKNPLRLLPIPAAVALFSALVVACNPTARATAPAASTPPTHLAEAPADTDWSAKDLDYWKSVLTPQQVSVCRQGGTERAWSGEHVDNHDPGVFACSSCGAALFDAETKFESGTGWPSFYAPVQADAVTLLSDRSAGMLRTEVRCGTCDAHLGHVFNDGPKPTGQRYCINSVCLLAPTGD
jgi:peptide-methionine (R)-S-oxide reductase